MAERQLLCRVLKEEEPVDFTCQVPDCFKLGKVRIERPEGEYPFNSDWYCKKHAHRGVKAVVKGEVEK